MRAGCGTYNPCQQASVKRLKALNLACNTELNFRIAALPALFQDDRQL